MNGNKALYTLALGLLGSCAAMAQVRPLNGTEDHPFNLTPFGALTSWQNINDPLGIPVSYKEFNKKSSADTSDIGLFWWDTRDVQSIVAVYDAPVNASAALPVIQYWQQSWPETPPKMPSKEDLEDDPWQGQWVTAATDTQAKGNSLVFTFQPMKSAENTGAVYLPGEITYRRTLKIRMVYPGKHAPLQSLQVFSVSKEKTSGIRIQITENNKNNTPITGSLEVFNGRLKDFSGWRWNSGDKKTNANSFTINLRGKTKGIIAHIYAAGQSLPGTNDETVVTWRSKQGTFSFSLNDVDKEPVYIPYFNAYITRADNPVPFEKEKLVKSQTIRERIVQEPEQSYDRARKEIPALDPTSTVGGGYIDLPLAADASWQKFSVQWGGNIVIDKERTKAQGNELLRCNWPGDDLRWQVGAGKEPVYRRTKENCQMSVMYDYLPIVQTAWNQDGLNYREEAFVTQLSGPLSPDDPDRNEQTPSILMVKITVSNPTLHADTGHLWLKGNKGFNGLMQDGELLLDQVNGKNYIRCYAPELSKGKATLLNDTGGIARILHRSIALEPNSAQAFYLSFPFVGDLLAGRGREIASLNYDEQKNRVSAYWRDLVTKASVYNVPERKFNEMSKAVIPHIRISVTKDPKSKLYMVPAAAFSYFVYPNEAVFQTLLLDRLGDFKTSADYLNTFMQLQGSRKLPGTFTGDQQDVFFGTKVDSVYDMTEQNGYNMHHGAVLWGLAKHYLYSGDREWLLKAAPNMIRAANWIIEQTAHTKHLDNQGNKVIHYGLLPAGSLEDPHDWQFWYATNAYACMGMETMAKAFKKAGLPQADSFRLAAEAYHRDIRESIERASERSPVVRLRNNTYVPYIPTRPYQRFRYFGSKKAEYYDRYKKNIYPALRLSATREALYGPIVLLKAGLIDADEPMAGWALDDWEDNLTLSSSLNLNVHGKVDDEFWFSRGGMVFQANLQNPVGIYLIRQEIPAAIRGLYDNFVSCLYPDVNAHTEEYREWGHGSGPFYKCPDEARFISQVCDLLVVEKKDELWLAAGTPRRWLEAGQLIELKNARTEYGAISYTLRAGKIPETVEASIELPAATCSKVLLFVRAPFQKPIRKVTINGQDWKEWDSAKECITIPQSEKHVQVAVSY